MIILLHCIFFVEILDFFEKFIIFMIVNDELS